MHCNGTPIILLAAKGANCHSFKFSSTLNLAGRRNFRFMQGSDHICLGGGGYMTQNLMFYVLTTALDYAHFESINNRISCPNA